MSDSPGAISPESLPRPGEIALLTAIDVALDVRPMSYLAGLRSSGATSARRWPQSLAAAGRPFW